MFNINRHNQQDTKQIAVMVFLWNVFVNDCRFNMYSFVKLYNSEIFTLNIIVSNTHTQIKNMHLENLLTVWNCLLLNTQSCRWECSQHCHYTPLSIHHSSHCFLTYRWCLPINIPPPNIVGIDKNIHSYKQTWLQIKIVLTFNINSLTLLVH